MSLKVEREERIKYGHESILKKEVKILCPLMCLW